jgi:hypothetical protein
MDTLTGFDGSIIKLHSRVEMHPATNFWMRGARFGSVIRVNTLRDLARVKLDKVRTSILVAAVSLKSIDEDAS